MNYYLKFLVLIFFCGMINHADGLLCYQCDSSVDEYCPESWDRDDIQPKSCDHVQNAAFCVKTTGMYGAIVGTRRFCSSRHMDNSCNEINLPQDSRIYYSCLYTCDTHGCNQSSNIRQFYFGSSLCIFFGLLFYF